LLDSVWEGDYGIANGTASARGVSILCKGFAYQEVFCSDDGRLIIGSLSNESSKILVSNLYCPNDHKHALTFFQNSFQILNETLAEQAEHPHNHFFLAGDLNIFLDDSSDNKAARPKSQSEKNLCALVESEIANLGMVDTCVLSKATNNFTGYRQEIFSRLDYVFASSSLNSKLCEHLELSAD